MTLAMAVSARVECVLEMCVWARFPKVEGSSATSLSWTVPSSGLPAA